MNTIGNIVVPFIFTRFGTKILTSAATVTMLEIIFEVNLDKVTTNLDKVTHQYDIYCQYYYILKYNKPM